MFKINTYNIMLTAASCLVLLHLASATLLFGGGTFGKQQTVNWNDWNSKVDGRKWDINQFQFNGFNKDWNREG